jgi:hypothetical protein
MRFFVDGVVFHAFCLATTVPEEKEREERKEKRDKIMKNKELGERRGER